MARREDGDLTARLDRIEANQGAFAEVLKVLMDRMDVQSEKLDAVLDAVTAEPGPSPLTQALEAILAELKAQSEMLHRLAGPAEDDADP